MDICSNEFFAKDTKITGFTQNKYINPLLKLIDEIQKENHVTGHVAEIGVHHGKSYLPLVLLTTDKEKGVAIDCFDNQNFNVDKSGKGNLSQFKINCDLFGMWDKTVIVSGDSQNMEPRVDWLGPVNKSQEEHYFRIFSVDGSHTKSATFKDLIHVSSVMDEYGIIIVDDYMNVTWPGVKAGTDKFLSRTSEWRCIYIGYNKLFLCKSKMYSVYWNKFLNVEHEILNQASKVYKSTIKDAAHYEKRMKLAGVWI